MKRPHHLAMAMAMATVSAGLLVAGTWVGLARSAGPRRRSWASALGDAVKGVKRGAGERVGEGVREGAEKVGEGVKAGYDRTRTAVPQPGRPRARLWTAPLG